MISPKLVETEAEEFERRAWMSVLSAAADNDLLARFEFLTARPQFTWLRAPEFGLVMVRGRAGGEGAAFNLGEMTVTRAAVRLEDGVAGFGYVAGRRKRAAEIAALVDAMMQSPRWRDDAERLVVAPLAAGIAATRTERQRKVAATKVEFFTMVRDRKPA